MLTVLEVWEFVRSHPGLTVTELAEAMGLPRPKVSHKVAVGKFRRLMDVDENGCVTVVCKGPGRTSKQRPWARVPAMKATKAERALKLDSPSCAHDFDGPVVLVAYDEADRTPAVECPRGRIATARACYEGYLDAEAFGRKAHACYHCPTGRMRREQYAGAVADG